MGWFDVWRLGSKPKTVNKDVLSILELYKNVTTAFAEINQQSLHTFDFHVVVFYVH